MDKVLIFLFRLGLQLVTALRIYSTWSRIYQFVWERKQREELHRFDSLVALVFYIRTLKWRADGWRELWDAISHPKTIQWRATNEPSKFIGDCLPEDTELLMGDFSFKKIKDIEINDIIVDSTGFTKVINKFEKSVKPVLKIELNNGEILECSEDHKLFLVPKNGKYFGSAKNKIEIRAKDIKIGDDLLQPENFPEGQIDLDQNTAWALGVFVADGWLDGERACISGKDGHKKEHQKLRLKSIFKNTSWHSRYIRIYDESFVNLVSGCGGTALHKRLPFVNVTKNTAINILKGLEADASIRNGTVVYGTISETLKNQIKILTRIAGFSCHIKKSINHGGLGKNPIFRITVRGPNSTKKFARVRSISLHDSVPMYDIETESHNFYLPKSDVVVHNCDDFAIYIANVILNELKNGPGWSMGLSKGILDAQLLSVGWYETQVGEVKKRGYSGHNVCLISYNDGTFAYMDYGYPHPKCNSIHEVAEQVRSSYSENYVSTGWALHDHKLRYLTGSWK